MEISEELKKLWEDFLSARPENIRKVAEKFPPWKKYRLKDHGFTGSVYIPRAYEEKEDGTVTIQCVKENKEMPILGGYSVFGIHPESLEEVEPSNQNGDV